MNFIEKYHFEDTSRECKGNDIPVTAWRHSTHPEQDTAAWVPVAGLVQITGAGIKIIDGVISLESSLPQSTINR